MSASLINRSLTTVRTELEFLRDSNVISEEAFRTINNNLPEKFDPNQSRESGGSNSEYVEALYRFDPQQDGDLALTPGDKIEVLEKPSPEWFKGRCDGKVGMFPANYVKPAFSGTTTSSRTNLSVAPPQYEQQMVPQNIQPQPSGSSYQQPLPYPPPSTNYYQQPPQQVQQQPQVVQQQPEQKKHGHLKKFGSQLGSAAIFGAGATIGSDIVNSIF